MKTADKARGKWRGILLTCGVDEKFLAAKHGPCLFCGGTDRYRWDNDKGSGTFFCSQCGHGDGFELLKRFKGWDFRKAAQEIDAIVGGVSPEPAKQIDSEETRKARLVSLWKGSRALTGTDPASRYLEGRKVAHRASCLRFHPDCPKPFGDGYGEAMLALVTAFDGKPLNIHRTFIEPLAQGQKRKRAMMQGELPEGCAVRLFEVQGDCLGIAEGIETAIAASKRFQMPVWAAINATLLAKWMPPEGVKRVAVFGDCDPLFGGQAAAYALAHKLAARHKILTEVYIPKQVGLDWADEDAT